MRKISDRKRAVLVILLAAMVALLIAVLTYTPSPAQTIGLATADGDTITAWKVVFWQITDSWDQPWTINSNRTLEVSFEQPLTGNDSSQVNNAIGTTTGLYFSRTINASDAVISTSGGVVSVSASFTENRLIATKWAMVVHSQDKAGNWSNNSKPFWFVIAKPPDTIAPSVPVTIRITIK